MTRVTPRAGPGEARVAPGGGARGAGFDRGRGSRGGGQRPRATLPTLSERALAALIGADAPPMEAYNDNDTTQSSLSQAVEYKHKHARTHACGAGGSVQ